MTKVGAKRSAPLLVTCAVLQGLILGPLLFSLYINDLPYHVNAKMNLYADDFALTISCTTSTGLASKLNEYVCILSCCFSQNQLSMNLNNAIWNP